MSRDFLELDLEAALAGDGAVRALRQVLQRLGVRKRIFALAVLRVDVGTGELLRKKLLLSKAVNGLESRIVAAKRTGGIVL